LEWQKGLVFKDDRVYVTNIRNKDQELQQLRQEIQNLQQENAALRANSAEIQVLRKELQVAREMNKKIAKRNDEYDSSKSCIVCLSHARDVLLNCGHFVICNSCSSQLTQCPMCKVNIIGKFKVFYS